MSGITPPEQTEELTKLYESMHAVLKDSDDADEKKVISKAIKDMSGIVDCLVIGESGVGKTRLVRSLLGGMADAEEPDGCEICEYRWGEQNHAAMMPDHTGKVFVDSSNMRGITLTDTKGLGSLSAGAVNRIRQKAGSCTLILAVFTPDSITAPKTWDIIEENGGGKMIPVLSKCDTVTESELTECVARLKSYMQDCGAEAPVFMTDAGTHTGQDGIMPADALADYINSNIISRSPVITERDKNIDNLRNELNALKKSFGLRREQYMSDAKILAKINMSMDAYVADRRKTVENLTVRITDEINRDLDIYEKEIISKLDPVKIKERFHSKEDFSSFLTMINENYRAMMSDSINRKVVAAVKECVNDLETVFRQSVGYLDDRKTVLEASDKFYSSLSTGREAMISDTRAAAYEVGEYCRTLVNASEDLFPAVWDAREKYDRNIFIRRTAGITAGTAAGTAGSVAALGAMKTVSVGATLGVNAAVKAGVGILATGQAFPIILVASSTRSHQRCTIPTPKRKCRLPWKKALTSSSVRFPQYAQE